jgi:Xaa-Pro aminopeptidase
MKRGWITWDKAELASSIFESRLAVVRKHLAAADLPALVVYTDVWRSNQGRYLSNIMPYWNRALLVIPRDGTPVLLCGLSPRVYPWIRSVTILDEIRPSPNIAQQLTKMCEEKGWTKLGVLDLEQLPFDLVPPNSVDVPWSAIHPGVDEAELSMYRHAAKMAREILTEAMSGGPGIVDHEFVGRLERRFRRAGVEDLVVLVTNGATPPLPPDGATLASAFSASVAMEYRGHWVKIARALMGQPEGALESKTELLSGPYPYESCTRADISSDAIFAVHH